MNIENITSLPVEFEPTYSDEIALPSNKVAGCMLRVSECLSRPVYSCCESYQQIRFVDAFEPQSGALYRLALKIGYFFAMVTWGVTALISALPALIFKVIGCCMLDGSFIHASGTAPVKTLGENLRLFTVVSWNVCCLPGFSLESGVVPVSLRVNRIADKLIEQNADVVLLNEVFGDGEATQISEKLAAAGYTRFFFHLADKKKVCGYPSGLFVATKFDTAREQFNPFQNNNQIERGVFSFDLMSEGRRFARIFTTHFSSSDVPADPHQEEIAQRQEQMETVVSQLPYEPICTYVGGDLNLDDVELHTAPWCTRFDKGKVAGVMTWRGDSACAAITGSRPSGPLNLDHALIVNNGAARIRTEVKSVGFDGAHPNREALSDHNLLYSVIQVT